MTRLIKKFRISKVAQEAISHHPGRLCNNQFLKFLMGLKVISHFQQFSEIHFGQYTKKTAGIFNCVFAPDAPFLIGSWKLHTAFLI